MSNVLIGDRCEFCETAGGGPVCRVVKGTVLAIGSQQSYTSHRLEEGGIIAWDDGGVTFQPFWNARFRSLSALDRQRANENDDIVRHQRDGRYMRPEPKAVR